MEPEIGHQDYSQLSCRMKVHFLILTINIYIDCGIGKNGIDTQIKILKQKFFMGPETDPCL